MNQLIASTAMNIPSKNECFSLMEKMNMLDHIVDHSIMVSNVALYLSLSLKKSQPRLNTHLTITAALLHDITKTRSLETHEIHSETGAVILCEMGYPEVAEIIRQHVVLDVYDDQSPVSEQEIVNYSDKRILHDEIVSLEKRMAYIDARYCTTPRFKKKFLQLKTATERLEKKIFSHLEIQPLQLSASLTRDIRSEDWHTFSPRQNTGQDETGH